MIVKRPSSIAGGRARGMLRDYLLTYVRYYRSIKYGYTTRDKFAILGSCVLHTFYPVSVLLYRLFGRSLNIWEVISQYTFRYRNLRFVAPGEISAITSLQSTEPSVKAILEQNQDGDAVDVGANFGFYTAILSRTIPPTRKVLSIEPDMVYFAYLTRNIRLNKCANTAALQVACWSTETSLSIARPIVGTALSSHVELRHKPDLPVIQGRPLDKVAMEYDCHPSIVKIDVEGAEVEVLRGMEQILERDKPTIVFEARERTVDDCRKILSRHGYRVQRMKDGNYLAESEE